MGENGETVKFEEGTAEVFNNFFGIIVKNLNISQHFDFHPIIENDQHPILKAILKYEKHPSILAIQTKSSRNRVLSFSEVSLKQILKKMGLLKLDKASQYLYIPTKIIMENWDKFSNFIFESINNL